MCCGCRVSSVGSWLGLQGPGQKVRVCGERERKARVMSPPNLKPQAEPEGLVGVAWRGGLPPAGLESVPEPENQAGFSTSPGARPGDGLEPGDLSELLESFEISDPPESWGLECGRFHPRDGQPPTLTRRRCRDLCLQNHAGLPQGRAHLLPGPPGWRLAFRPLSTCSGQSWGCSREKRQSVTGLQDQPLGAAEAEPV